MWAVRQKGQGQQPVVVASRRERRESDAPFGCEHEDRTAEKWLRRKRFRNEVSSLDIEDGVKVYCRLSVFFTKLEFANDAFENALCARDALDSTADSTRSHGSGTASQTHLLRHITLRVASNDCGILGHILFVEPRLSILHDEKKLSEPVSLYPRQPYTGLTVPMGHLYFREVFPLSALEFGKFYFHLFLTLDDISEILVHVVLAKPTGYRRLEQPWFVRGEVHDIEHLIA